MSRTPKNVQNTQQLKILKNELTGIEPKSIFDRIKTLTKGSQKSQQMQVPISKQLSLFLRRTVTVSVVPIQEMPEPQSQCHARLMHKYNEPTIILEDSTNYYRIWVQQPPKFEGIKEFRKPPSTELVTILVKPEEYEPMEVGND